MNKKPVSKKWKFVQFNFGIIVGFGLWGLTLMILLILN